MFDENEMIYEPDTGDSFYYRRTAEEISECNERESRRYDKGFEIY